MLLFANLFHRVDLVLRRWSLRNFKPIQNEASLSLGKISVLAGLNSSGKSSVLQSILLISQSLSNQIVDRPLILNGNIVQLGTFDNVHNDRAADKYIGVGFEYVLDEEERHDPRVRSVRARYSSFDRIVNS